MDVYVEIKPAWLDKLRFRLYWHLIRPFRAENIAWWLAGCLPRSVRYWVVVRATIDTCPHDVNPTIHTALDILKGMREDDAE